MILTNAEKCVLRTYHPSRYEPRQIRSRLKADGLRFCTRCEVAQPLDAFSTTRHECRPCSAKTSAEYRAANRDEINHRRGVYRCANRSFHNKPARADPEPISDLLSDDFEESR